MLVIFGMSTDIGSAAHTSRILLPLLHWVYPQISLAAVELVQTIIRKTAHVTEYAILASLLLRALRSVADWSWTRQAALALAIAVCYAAGDEFHQTFVASRTASPHDVLFDACGAVIGVVLYGWFAFRLQTRRVARA
jgi:VanZ family protein